MHIRSVSTQYVPSQIAFGLLYRVFVPFIRSSSFSNSLLTLESSPNHSFSDTLGLLVLLPTSAIILASCRLWSLLRMRITNVQYGRIFHSCSMKHLYYGYAHLEYRINVPYYTSWCAITTVCTLMKIFTIHYHNSVVSLYQVTPCPNPSIFFDLLCLDIKSSKQANSKSNIQRKMHMGS